MFYQSVLKLVSATTISQVLVVLSLPFLVLLYEPSAFAIYALYIALVNVVASAACLRLEHAIVIAKAHQVKALYSISMILACTISILSPLIVAITWAISDIIGENLVLYIIAVPVGTFLTAVWNVNYSHANRIETYGRIGKAQISKNFALISIQLVAGYLVLDNSSAMIAAHIFSLIVANFLLRTSLPILFRLKYVLLVVNRHNKFPKFSAPSIFINTLGKSSIPFFIGATGGEIILGYYSLIDRALGAPATLLGVAIGRVYYRSAAKLKNLKKDALNLFDSTSLTLFLLSLCIFSLAYVASLAFEPDLTKNNWTGAFDLIPILLPLYLLKFAVVPVSMTTAVYEKQRASLAWNLIYVLSLNAVLFFSYSVANTNYELILNIYVYWSILFYGILFILLRKFITESDTR